MMACQLIISKGKHQQKYWDVLPVLRINGIFHPYISSQLNSKLLTSMDSRSYGVVLCCFVFLGEEIGENELVNDPSS